MIFIALYCSFVGLIPLINRENKIYFKKNHPEVIIKSQIDRKCFLCHQKLNIQEFYKANKNLSKDRITKLWNNEKIQYFCCSCYDLYKDDINVYLFSKKNEIKS